MAAYPGYYPLSKVIEEAMARQYYYQQKRAPPDQALYGAYLNAVAAGANFAIVNRMVIAEEVAAAFEETFAEPLELVYEISHNLVQREVHPELGVVLVHRKGATRAFPAGHPALAGGMWAETGHPVLIPGSNSDLSFILRPLPCEGSSVYSVNHGAGRRLSRSAAMRRLDQRAVDADYRREGILRQRRRPGPAGRGRG